MSYLAFRVDFVCYTFFRVLHITDDTLEAKASVKVAQLVSSEKLDEAIRLLSAVFKVEIPFDAYSLIFQQATLEETFKKLCTCVCTKEIFDPQSVRLTMDIRRVVNLNSHITHSPLKEYGETVFAAVEDALKCAALLNVQIDPSRMRKTMLRVEKRIHVVRNFTDYIKHAITRFIIVATIFDKEA